jgi:hypothetical protein
MKEFLKYILWAAVQHSLVIPLVYFCWQGDPWRQSVAGILLFSIVGHIDNLRLIICTFILSLVFYPLFFFFDNKILVSVLLVIVHAAGGTYLKLKGYEMRVWRFLS